MKRTPAKPHFFTFVSPESKNGALIPISFLCKHLNEMMCDYALLRRGSKKWGVKIDGRLFGKGWERFEKDNGLEIGDFIVFSHQGDMVFDVMVFDPTMCERDHVATSKADDQYHPYRKEVDITGEGKMMISPPTRRVKSSKEPTKILHERSKKLMKKKTTVSHVQAKAMSGKQSNHPYFRATITAYNLKKSILRIPTEFARSNGLSNRNCEMILRDEEQRSWPVKLRQEATQVCVGGGWSYFHEANGLQEGDDFILQLIKQGERPLMNFRRLKKQPEKAPMTAARIRTRLTSADCSCPHFTATLKEHSIKKSILYIPNGFARSNRLTNCEMILRNENQRSWLVEVRDQKRYVYFGRGWRDFCVANNFKEGDCLKFELVYNGKKPIVNISPAGMD